MPKPNWGGGLGSAASGAISGASIGSAIPVVGTGIGAAIGGIFGGIGGLFGNKKKKAKKLSTLDPQQKALYDQYISALSGQGPHAGMFNFDQQGYNNVFDQSIARPAYRNFQENIIPQITGQFRGSNIGNSSYTGESLSRAGRNVQENLDALRSQNVFAGQQQANMNKQNAIQNILGTQTFATARPQEGNPSVIDQILGSLAPQAGQWFGDYLKGLGGTSTPIA